MIRQTRDASGSFSPAPLSRPRGLHRLHYARAPARPARPRPAATFPRGVRGSRGCSPGRDGVAAVRIGCRANVAAPLDLGAWLLSESAVQSCTASAGVLRVFGVEMRCLGATTKYNAFRGGCPFLGGSYSLAVPLEIV